jgi:hypothetical protein
MSAGRWIAAHGAAALCGAVLLWAGMLKTGDAAAFGRLIQGYRLLPEALVPAAAVVLPWLEVATGVFLLANRFRLGAAVIAAGLSAGFLVAGASVLARGIETTCGCFGGWSGNVGVASLAIELALAAVAAWALRTAWRAAAPAGPAATG